MAYQLDLLPALKDWGLNVHEVAGWQTRGSAYFTPRGSVNHHTAGSSRGNLPSYSVLVYGRSGLPGPLCNVAQARNNDVYLVAAGRANHAGRGGWSGLSGNSSVFGLEVENTGYASGPRAEPWRDDQIETMLKVHNAFAQVGGFASSFVCQHKEWTSRKIDAHTINGRHFRAGLALQPAPTPTPTPPPTPPPTPTEPTLVQGEPDMFLVLDGVGIYAVVDGIPIGFNSLAEYAKAKSESPGVPTMTLRGEQAAKMNEWLLKKLAAAVR